MRALFLRGVCGRSLTLFALVATATWAGSASADDVADESDVQFSVGADAYQKNDFKGALEHFLASNRLVKNRNVLFNIARSYEQLKQFPEAHRYYSRALEGETDESATARVKEAVLARQHRAEALSVKINQIRLMAIGR